MNITNGTPVLGYLSLTNAAPGPTAIAFTFADGTNRAYTFNARERLYVTNIAISTNDTTQRLVTVDSGGTTPTKLASQYVVSPGITSTPPTLQFPPGTLKCEFGVAPRAGAAAVTNPLTIEVTIAGYVART